MKKFHKILSLMLAMAMVLSLGMGALASGEASGAAGSSPPAPTSSMAQNVEDMKTTAAISVIDGVVETDDTAMTGTVTTEGITGVMAFYDGIGDWDGSLTFGHFGAVLSGTDEAEYVIGGAEDLYEVDGQGYNTVFILNAEDKDEANALGGSETRDYKDAQEGAEGAGIYADMPNFLIDNVYISTVGYGRSALHLTADVQDTVVRDSTIIATGSEGEDSSAPGIIMMYASSRPVLIEASGSTYFYNSDLISSDWGVYSLDGCYNANIYIVDCYSENTVGGYSMYALGFDAPNTCWFYGSYAASAQYGTILCAAGRTYTGALSDFAYRVWTCLITMADDTGCGDARPAIIKGFGFPLREAATAECIQAALAELEAVGCIRRYTVEGQAYFQFPNWSRHQRVRNVRPKFPGPELADGAQAPAEASVAVPVAVPAEGPGEEQAPAEAGTDGRLREPLSPEERARALQEYDDRLYERMGAEKCMEMVRACRERGVPLKPTLARWLARHPEAG